MDTANVSGINKTIEPVEAFVFSGVQVKTKSVFNAPFYMVQSTDVRSVLQQLKKRANDVFLFPYITGRVGSIEERQDVNGFEFARNGVTVSVEEKQAWKALLIPVTFTLECNYFAKSYREMQDFASTLMFARRRHLLNFNIVYGRTSLGNRIEVDSNLSLVERSAELEQEQMYQVPWTMRLHSWISTPNLVSQQIYDGVELVGIMAHDGSDRGVYEAIREIGEPVQTGDSQSATNSTGSRQFWSINVRSVDEKVEVTGETSDSG